MTHGPRLARHAARASLAVAILVSARAATGDRAPILIDGAATEWHPIPFAYVDATGDQSPGGIDLRRLQVADDDRFLFIRFSMDQAVDLSENNDLRLYLDTDADAGTGLAVNGIGAELEWRFGERFGFFRHGGDTTSIEHDAIRFRGQPTVTSTTFEIAIGRDTLPDGANPLFTGDTVRIVIAEQGGDELPESGEIITYTLDVGDLPPDPAISLGREDPGDVRMITYNVLNDSPWQSGQEPRFGRQFAAVDPDILNFQEISGHSAAETLDLVDDWIPGPWFAAGQSDCKTISRFPVLGSWPLDGNLAVLLDTSAALGVPLLLINAHLPCCTNDSGRQSEVDRIIAFIRDARNGSGPVELTPQSPVIITGDLNLVGLAQQLATLLTGDIVNQGTHGPDAAPDGDGTALTNLLSRQTEKRMGYTWRNDSSSFWPGHLDYIIYSDSVLAPKAGYVLYTPEMSPSILADAGLLANDSLASDHLLFCADFGPIDDQPEDVNGDGNVNIDDLVLVVLAWGPCDPGPCDEDVNGDGMVGIDDLVLVVLSWTG